MFYGNPFFISDRRRYRYQRDWNREDEDEERDHQWALQELERQRREDEAAR